MKPFSPPGRKWRESLLLPPPFPPSSPSHPLPRPRGAFPPQKTPLRASEASLPSFPGGGEGALERRCRLAGYLAPGSRARPLVLALPSRRARALARAPRRDPADTEAEVRPRPLPPPPHTTTSPTSFSL